MDVNQTRKKQLFIHYPLVIQYGHGEQWYPTNQPRDRWRVFSGFQEVALVLLGATVYMCMMNVSGCKIQLFSIFAIYLRKNQQAAQSASKLPVSIWYDLIHGIFMLGLKIRPWKFHPLSLPCLPGRSLGVVSARTEALEPWKVTRWDIPDGFSYLCWWCSVKIVIMLFRILIKVCFVG